MKDSELQIDRSCHVLYSKPCKKEILAKITLHYPEVEREAVWEQVQLRYAELLSKWRTDLGGKKNFHNGVGGTYDCIAIMCFYDVCRDVVTFREMEEIEENLILPSFRKLRFVDINKPFWKKLMYRAFSTAQKHCDTWHDYEMDVTPYENSKPIYYEFTACPAAEFAKRFGFADIMPALCNVDYASINAIYLYDDKVLITFNYKEGTETVAFGEAVKAEKSSDMSARGAPNFKRQIVRFGVLSFI